MDAFVLLLSRQDSWFSCVGIRLLPGEVLYNSGKQNTLNASLKAIFPVTLFQWHGWGRDLLFRLPKNY